MSTEDSENAEESSYDELAQGSFEERLRVASERRAKVLALKEKEAEKLQAFDDTLKVNDVVPIRARKYIRPGTGRRDHTAEPDDSRRQEGTPRPFPSLVHSDACSKIDAPNNFAGTPSSAEFQDRPKDALRETRIGHWDSHLKLVVAFLIGTAVGCLLTLWWTGAIDLPM